MNNEREDVSMIEGELPVQPTQPTVVPNIAPTKGEEEAKNAPNNGRASRREEGPVETPAELTL